MLSEFRLKSLLERFPQLNIALLGDLFLDRYLEIDAAADEPSVETGLTAYQVVRVRNSPGALGTVMNNLAALGVGRLLPVSVIGDDGHGFDLRREVEKLPTDLSYLVQASERLTPTYTKPMRQDERGDWVELNRLDVRTRSPLSETAEAALLTQLERAWSVADGLIVLDQLMDENCGVVNQNVRERLAQLSQRDPEKLVFVDSRGFLGAFACGMLKGNRSEVCRAAGIDALTPASVEEAVTALAQRTCRPAFATAGEAGIVVASVNGPCQTIPAVAVPGPIDVVGAGDSATAGLVASMLAGANLMEAAETACLIASITVQQLGTTGVATPEQVLQRHRQHAGHSRGE
jgi:rfaE bifunctional protein kinase chain/domain